MAVADVGTHAPTSAEPFEHLVLDFLAYLEFERGLSRNTLEAYRSDLLQYGAYLNGRDALAVTHSELAEEIGKQAAHWDSLGAFYTSAGFADEVIHLFLATGISDVPERPAVEEDERIHIEVRPLSELDTILTETMDSKTLIALYRLRDHLSRS